MAVRRVLVTGGSRGLGAAIATALAAAGFDVAITARSQVSLSGSSFAGHPVDFSSLDATEAFAGEVEGMGIDVLVNNAGINKIAPFDAIDSDDFQRIHRVNVLAPMLLCRAVLPHMRAQGWGRIVNVASIFGEVSREHRASYSASKSGLIGMTRALAAEVARDGVLANCVSPGVIETELTRQVLGDEGVARIIEEIPVGRLGQPKEVAALVRFLASDENTYISGQSILVDGGFTSV